MARIVKLDSPKSGKARYRIRVFNGSDPRTGKKIVITKTIEGEAEAKAEATRLEGLRDAGTLTTPSKESLSQYLERWLRDVKSLELRARTLDDYRSIVARYVDDPPKGAPNIGVIRLDRLTHHAIQELYSYLSETAGLSRRTVQYLHAVLRQALTRATQTGDLQKNPAEHVTVSTIAPEIESEDGEGAEVDDDEEVRSMDETQAQAFLAAARADRYFPLWAVLLHHGLRPSEALALAWDDVDLETGMMRVRRALTRRGQPEGRPWKREKVKTKKSNRVVHLAPSVVRALREWRTKTLKERMQVGAEYASGTDFVFCNEFGKPLHQPNLYNRNFRRIMAAAELGECQEVVVQGKKTKRTKTRFIPAFSMYELRHTCASLALKNGEDVKVVSEMLGHRTVAFTLDTYAHVLPDQRRQVAHTMERVLGGA